MATLIIIMILIGMRNNDMKLNFEDRKIGFGKINYLLSKKQRDNYFWYYSVE